MLIFKSKSSNVSGSGGGTSGRVTILCPNVLGSNPVNLCWPNKVKETFLVPIIINYYEVSSVLNDTANIEIINQKLGLEWLKFKILMGLVGRATSIRARNQQANFHNICYLK